MSNDIRMLLASDLPAAKMAVEYFVQHVALTCGTLAVSMSGLNEFVFTAGTGEHNVEIRAHVLERLAWFRLKLDPDANRASAGRITAADCRSPAYLVPTDEEQVIGNATGSLIGA